jgi:flagellar basal-body rod protein FlgB
MFETLDLTRMANAMAVRAGDRLGVIAQNVANADTPGYKAMDLPSFAETYAEDGREMRATRPGHLAALGDSEALPRRDGATASPNGNSVSVEQEMVKSAGVRQDHDMALAIYRNTTEILRASLGKSR